MMRTDNYKRAKHTELKPCPFCGGEAKLVGSNSGCLFYVECTDCEASTTSTPIAAEAAEFWNRRVRDDEKPE